MQCCASQMYGCGVQVAAERHSEELRAVCVDITANCLPDVLVRIQAASINWRPLSGLLTRDEVMLPAASALQDAAATTSGIHVV